MDPPKNCENTMVNTIIDSKGFKKLQNSPKVESLYFPLISLLINSVSKKEYLLKFVICSLSLIIKYLTHRFVFYQKNNQYI